VYEGLGQQNILYIPITILQHTTGMTSVFTSPDVNTDPLRSMISVDQQSIVMDFSLKGLNAVEIHNDLVATFKGKAKSYSTVTYSLRKPSFSSPKTPQPSESPASILNESDEAILPGLSEEPFASVRHLARRTHLRGFTVYDHLTHKLGFVVGYRCWVPHFLSEADKHTEHNFHLNFLKCFSTRKTGRGMTL
jgi:hypothetical protein